MKKIYSVMMLAIMTLVMSFSANAAINVTLKVDDATRLTANYMYYDETTYSPVQTDLDLTQFTGENGGTFTIPASYGNVYVYATEGNTITYAMNETTGSANRLGTSTDFYVYSDAVLSVKSADIEASRTASCTINVDDASKVSVAYNSGTNINLENGANTVKFNPTTESPLEIMHATYGESLYSVLVNNVEQTDSYGRYYVNVADGDVIDINANFPNLPSTINFNYGENESEVLGCISVEVNGEKVEDFDGKTLTATLGQTVKLIGDTELYNFNYAIYINGEYVSFYGDYTFTVTKTEYTIAINATKYQTYNVFVTVDNAENVELYAGNSNNAATLVSGEAATIALSSSSNYINVRPATSNCFISSITVNGSEYGSNYGTSSVTIQNLNENDQVVISTGTISRDKTATIWVDDISAAKYGYSVQRYSDRQSVNLISGETVVVNFDDSDNPYYISFYQPTVCDVFMNGIYKAPDYEGSTYYYITFVNGDAAKIYLAASPEKFAVSFNSTIENAIATVATDSQTYDNWATGFTALTGTEVTFTLAEGVDAAVNVDGNAVTPNENGVYSVIVSANTVINITETTNIENISADKANNNVYNMQGILVVKNATTEAINNLPAGLYIVNGKKIIR